MKTDEEWKQQLTPEQYRILRQKGTEAPFSGALTNNTDPGVYTCAGCGAKLFMSDAKHESVTPGLQGWPSFAEAAEDGVVELRPDNSLDMERTEVVCANCGGHLGHLFEGVKDTPSGKHFCINSCSLDFKPQENKES
jgi:peptide-methionine (R)-S-oxide reductase